MAKKKITRNARPKKAPARKTKPEANGKISALDAAVKVLTSVKKPMNAKQLVEAMATKNLWKSPGGKTPDRTLYAAIAREISTKGTDSRFKKSGKGQFAKA